MSENKGLLSRFFGGISTFLGRVRLVLINLLTAIILISLLFSIGAIFSQRDNFEIPEEGALRVSIDGSLVDQRTYTDSTELLLNPDIPGETLVYELVQAIEMAAQDERINSLILVLHDFQSGGMSKIQEVGQAISVFRQSGKPVLAVSDSYSQQQYLLASYADRILMNPMGVVEVLGISSYRTYMADALEKLKVDVNVFRTGPHKNAVEPFIANEMSESTREQSRWLIDDLWSQYEEGLFTRREIQPDKLFAYTQHIDEAMENTGMSLAEIALDTNLVDALVTRDQLMEEIQAIAGANDEGDFYNFTNAIPYYRNNRDQLREDSPKVGYIVAKGQIYDGTQPSGNIGGDSLAYQLKQARLKQDLDALVLRVDSPGGSAFASEVIRRELELFQEENIPIVVSMSSLAASGGYWIAMPANEIWAMPSTVTGSIGAFSVVPTFNRTMESLGLHADGVETSPLSSAFRLDKPLSEQAQTIFQSQIDYLYEVFLGIVANGRNMSLEQVEPVAGGRVWTGQQALELGLVDKLGSQFQAIQSAAALAGIADNFQVQTLEPELSFGEQLIRELLEQISAVTSINSLLGTFAGLMKEAQSELSVLLSDPQHMYLHCENCLIEI